MVNHRGSAGRLLCCIFPGFRRALSVDYFPELVFYRLGNNDGALFLRLSNETPGSTVPFITHRSKLTASQQGYSALEADRPVERELAGGETHAFQVALAAGQYLRVVVNQRGIDIGLKLSGPDGQRLVEMDSPNATQGPEIASVIAAQSGSYRIEVVSLTKDAAPGKYEAKVAALRAATEQDRKWTAAQSAYVKGQQLRGQGT